MGDKKDGGKGVGSGMRRLPATEERQYMIDGDYEVYEKIGAPTGAMSFHYHNFYELLYVLDGEYSSMVETQSYQLHKGDFLLIDQNCMHKYQPSGKEIDNSRRIILWVTNDYLQELSGEGVDLSECFRKEGERAWHFPVYYEEMLRGFLLKLAMEGEASGLRRTMDRGYLTLLFAHLNMLCGRKESLLSGKYVAQHPMVETVDSYIEEHMAEGIPLDRLAEQVHMSKYHFLRKFKDLTGVTAHAYVMNKRLIRACELLQKGESITDVYLATGFGDYSVFLRNFKNAFGMSPREYRG